MSSANTSNRGEKFTGAVIFAVFLALAAWVWLPGATPAPTVQPTPASNLDATLQAGQEQMASLIAVTTERPLFHATRTPPAAPEAPAAPVVPEPTLTLVGILGVDEDKVALVRISTSPELFRLGAGAQLGDWEIVSIDTDEVTISKNGGAPQKFSIDR